MAIDGMKLDSKAATNAANRASARLTAKISKEMKMMANAISTLEKKIIAEVKALKTAADGTLVGPRVNLKQAQKLHTKLTQQFEETFNTTVKSHVKGYNQVKQYVEDNFNDLDIAMSFTSVDATMMDELANQAVLGFTSLGTAAKSKIEQALYNSVATNAPFDDLVGTISAALTGKLDKRGRPLSANAALYANDAIMNFYNSVHYKKGQDAGLEHYLYSGTIMANTRDFCRQRVGRVFSVEEINSWTGSWAGKSGPALTHRGGWNCRHHWQAVKPEWVPEVEDRKLEAAYKPPSKRLKERAAELGGLAFKDLDKLQKSQVGKIGVKLKKGTLNNKTKYLETWDLLDDNAKLKKLNEWKKKGYTIPEWFEDYYGPETKLPGLGPPPIKKPPKLPKPKPPKIKVTDPEQIITGPLPTVEPGDVGLSWKQLDSKGKAQIGKIGKKMSKGNFNKKSVYVKKWEELSMETQQMKIAQWKAKGIPIHPELPLKGVANQVDNLTSNIAKTKTFKEPKNFAKTKSIENKQKQFDYKYNVQKLDPTTYTDEKAYQLFDVVDDELDRLTSEFPFIDDVLNNEVNPLQGIEMIEGKSVGGTAAASYSDTTKIMKLPGQAKKKIGGMTKVGKSTINDWSSVDDGFYDYFRHELGHTVDKGLRDMFDKGLLNTDHQSNWRAIFKKYDKNEWAKYFGKYSTTDKYEGFAEAFKIYTSPKYKAGKLPYEIESYLHQLLGGGKLKPPKGVTAKLATPQGRIFADKKVQAKYEQYFDQYRARKMTKSQLKTEIKSRCPGILKAADDWQGSTQTYGGSALKLQAELLENGNNIKWFGSSSSGMGSGSSAKRVAEYMRDHLPDEEYIRLRAMTQEYYDRKGITTIKLSRGTDGSNSGPAFRQKVNEVKKSVPEAEWSASTVEFKEPALNGWSSKHSVANSFGSGGGGVTVTTEIPTRDILLPDDMWPKRGYKTEYETIVVRRVNQAYRLSDVKSGYGRMGLETTTVAKKYVKDLAKWGKKTPDVLTKMADIETGVLHYLKQQVPDYADGKHYEIISKLQNKINGITKAAEQGKEIKLLGKRVADESVGVLKQSMVNLKEIYEDIYHGSSEWVGIEEAIDKSKIELIFG